MIGHSTRNTGAGTALATGLAACLLWLAAALASSFATGVVAGEVDVVDVSITALGERRYRIDVTLAHDDTGWDHYANRWDVVAPDGSVLGSRELLHPHVDEQPFTRSLTLDIPDGIDAVTLQGNDLVHGTGGTTRQVDVPG